MSSKSKNPRSASWSLAGAARSARQSRIGTAEFLQTAECARLWEAGKLRRAHYVHTEHAGHPQAASAILFGGLGYLAPYPSDWDVAADMIVQDEARYLLAADLYVLTPQMCDVVVAAAQSLSREDLLLLDPDDLPSPTGLVVLPEPLVTRTIGGDLSDLRAFAWHTPAAVRFPDGQGGVGNLSAVRMSTYQATSGPVQPESFREFAAYARQQGTPLPQLLLDAKRCMPFHAHSDGLNSLDGLSAAARSVDEAVRSLSGLGPDEEGLGEYVSGGQINDDDDTFMIKFLYAFWRLCEQRIASVDTAETTHSARLIAARAGVDPEVRVVQLRQIGKNAETDNPAGREWKHRWVVRMHKVRQWYPSEQRHKVIYRGPYVKGPGDKPFIGGETVRALIR